MKKYNCDSYYITDQTERNKEKNNVVETESQRVAQASSLGEAKGERHFKDILLFL